MRLNLNIETIRQIMEQKGWDEKKLAAEIGVSRTQVYRVFRGQRAPGNEFIAGLISVFKSTSLKKLFHLNK
ncbi:MULTISPECIES: helix-turn-helix domain-containing protein [Paenibacillus]|uniref:Helix-turn-helix transcriptional regulator n=1 Tax=Paenibacillus artemisiicola TaxID=1172618 RepID=A0ABS3W796_9BACL|nr:helix-turn-helix transcriptional regulator [Paenibacillus artemisiicola]MBO7744164.1 helix-turn-helix transcriptional regulator [Paenibacillus artemisiicola]